MKKNLSKKIFIGVLILVALFIINNPSEEVHNVSGENIIYSETITINGRDENIFLEKEYLDEWNLMYDLLFKINDHGFVIDTILHDGANPEVENIFIYQNESRAEYLVAQFSWHIRNKIEDINTIYYEVYIYDESFNKIDNLTLNGQGEDYPYQTEELITKSLIQSDI